MARKPASKPASDKQATGDDKGLDQGKPATGVTGGDPGPLDEPSEVGKLPGGQATDAGSLEAAAENAKNAKEVSEGRAGEPPPNPVDGLRGALQQAADFAGPEVTARTLGTYYGVSKVEDVPPNNLLSAIDELHIAGRKEADKNK